MNEMYVQYGCGFCAPEEWTNFDASPTLKWERLPLVGRMYTKNSRRFPANVRVGDIVRGLPVAERSCSGVYASHVLEHLSLSDFHKALANTRRILRSGGLFRTVVPDLEFIAREYLRRFEKRDDRASEFFMDAGCLGQRDRRRGLSGLVYDFLQTSEHRWMWDELSMSHALKEHGFTQIRRCSFGDCADPLFALVEDRGRFEGAVAMEARG
jgi:SAM-dependent methyltransferase